MATEATGNVRNVFIQEPFMFYFVGVSVLHSQALPNAQSLFINSVSFCGHRVHEARFGFNLAISDVPHVNILKTATLSNRDSLQVILFEICASALVDCSFRRGESRGKCSSSSKESPT